MKELNLSGNKLRKIEKIAFPELLTLDLSGNKLETVDLRNLKKLEKLLLQKNKLKTIESFQELVGLKELKASENAIAELRFLNNHRNL